MRDTRSRCRPRGALLLAVLAASPATAPAQRLDPSFPRELEEYIATTIREWELPGVAIAVVKDGRVLVARGYGVRELGKPAPVDGQTIFDIASLTKSFTAAAIGTLVDDSTLSWDDPVSRILPEVEFADPYLTANVTLRDLLAHRTGLPAANGPTFTTILPRDRLLRLVRYVEPVAPFRARYIYSNLGYTVAGEAGARAAGTTWERLVTERLLRPLGMSRTTADFADAPRLGNLAVGHALFRGEERPVPRGDASRTHTAPAGAVQSSAADLATWMLFQLGDGTHGGRRVLSPDVMAAMHSPHILSPTTEAFRASRQVRYFAGYGLGWQIFDYRGHILWWHSGNGDGQVARMVLMPELRLGVAVLVNSWKAGGPFNHAIALRVIDHYLGVEPRDYAAEARAERLAGVASRARQERDLTASRQTGTAPSLPLSGYAGSYRDRYELPWIVSLGAATLLLRYANGDIANLEHWHHDTFRMRWSSPLRADDGERPLFVRFAVSAAGVADTLTLDPGLFGEAATARREPPPRFMFIYRDSLKQGVDSAYRAIEADAARICSDLKCPNPYLALESLSGPHEAWWLNAFAGEADTTRVSKAYAANRPLMDALGAIAKRKEPMIGTPISGFAVYRAELSRGPAWSVAGARFMVVTVTRSRRPAEGSAWEMADSTLYVLRPAKTRGEAESLARGGARIFAVRPSWSMPAPEWVVADSGFWRRPAVSPWQTRRGAAAGRTQASRTRGATRVPIASIAFMSFAWGSEEAFI